MFAKVIEVCEEYFVVEGGKMYKNPLNEVCSCKDFECLLFWCPEMLSEENEVGYE